MFIYYVLILISVLMFGGGFALQDVYRKKRGSGLLISMESSCIGSVAGLVVLLIINGFCLEITPFTLLMAVWTALNGMAFTFCSFRALEYINLSLFSLFTMLGGMALPFFQGILFYNEHFTLAKGVCIVFICTSLICTVQKGDKKSRVIYYVGIFIFNGLSGVISKIFTESNYVKASAAGYSILIAIATALLSGIAWFVMCVSKRRKGLENVDDMQKISNKNLLISYGIGGLQGAINKIANFLLVIALSYVDASVQYPMVTGGTMIVSTVISFLGDKKPSKKEVLSVALAFLGMLALFLIPV